MGSIKKKRELGSQSGFTLIGRNYCQTKDHSRLDWVGSAKARPPCAATQLVATSCRSHPESLATATALTAFAPCAVHQHLPKLIPPFSFFTYLESAAFGQRARSLIFFFKKKEVRALTLCVRITIYRARIQKHNAFVMNKSVSRQAQNYA